MPATLEIWNHLQRRFFPVPMEEMGSLTAKDNQFVEVMGLLPLGPFLEPYRWVGTGCPPHERDWLLHAFIAKAVYEFPTTRALLEALAARPPLGRLCGGESAGEVPHESTFSRAFAAFAQDELPQKIHAALVCRQRGQRLVGHVRRDATAMDACEKAAAKPAVAPKAPAKSGCVYQMPVTPPGTAETGGPPSRAHLGRESGRLADGLRRGLQAQQQRPSGVLDWLQIACGHHRRGHPRQPPSDPRLRPLISGGP